MAASACGTGVSSYFFCALYLLLAPLGRGWERGFSFSDLCGVLVVREEVGSRPDSRLGCAAKLAALLRRSAQTAAASQLTKRVRPSAHTPPHRLRASAQVEGNGGAPVARLLNDIWLKRRCSKRCKLFSWKRFSLFCPLSRVRERAGVREELLPFPRWGKGGWGHCAFVWALCLW